MTAARCWSSIHVPYRCRRERCELLLAWAERLRGRPWWWADVDVAEGPILELAVRSASAVAGDGPLVMRPSLFPGGEVPDWFPQMLATTSLRALGVLAGAPSRDEPVPWDVVAAEIDRLYVAIVADAPEHRAVLQWHERWIRGDRPEPVAAGVDAARVAILARVGHLQTVRLRGLGGDLEAEARMIRGLREMGASRPAGDPRATGRR